MFQRNGSLKERECKEQRKATFRNCRHTVSEGKEKTENEECNICMQFLLLSHYCLYPFNSIMNAENYSVFPPS